MKRKHRRTRPACKTVDLQPTLTPECDDVADLIPEVRASLLKHDVRIRTSILRHFRGPATLHVIFEHRHRRLLEWWPSNGTAIALNSQKGKIDSLPEAAGLALDIREAIVQLSLGKALRRTWLESFAEGERLLSPEEMCEAAARVPVQ